MIQLSCRQAFKERIITIETRLCVVVQISLVSSATTTYSTNILTSPVRARILPIFAAPYAFDTLSVVLGTIHPTSLQKAVLTPPSRTTERPTRIARYGTRHIIRRILVGHHFPHHHDTRECGRMTPHFFFETESRHPVSPTTLVAHGFVNIHLLPSCIDP